MGFDSEFKGLNRKDSLALGSGHYNPREKCRYTSNMKLFGSQTRFGHVATESNPCLYIEPYGGPTGCHNTD